MLNWFWLVGFVVFWLFKWRLLDSDMFCIFVLILLLFKLIFKYLRVLVFCDFFKCEFFEGSGFGGVWNWLFVFILVNVLLEFCLWEKFGLKCWKFCKNFWFFLVVKRFVAVFFRIFNCFLDLNVLLNLNLFIFLFLILFWIFE